MIQKALLWVSHPQLLFERVGGLSVLERHLWTASRAGLGKVWISAQEPGPLSRLRLPPGLELAWSQREGQAQRDCQPPYLVLSGDHFIRVETLRHIATSRYPGPAALEDAAGNPVVQVVPFRSDRVLAQHRQPLPLGASVHIESPVSQGPALGWLLAAGVKAGDGFMARHFDRRLSLAFSRFLLDTPVSPNMMTVLSCLVGLWGASFFLRMASAAPIVGAALVWLHSVLDGCDGELARIRFQESAVGADIDFWGDNLVHLALFGCLAWGFHVADRSPLPLLLGAAAAVGILGSALLVYREKLARRRQALPPPEPAWAGSGLCARLLRMEEWLAQRDFIYLLLVLAYLGRTYEFLWAGAIGSLLFFVMTLFLGRVQHHEQTIDPHPAR